MNVPLFIARRYFLSRRLPNAINLITWISITAIAVVTAALIIALSIFNGFENLLGSLFSTFDPAIRISVTEGRWFEPDSATIRLIRTIEGVAVVEPVVEGKAMLKYYDKQSVVMVKGIQKGYLDICPVDEMVIDGAFTLHNTPNYREIVPGAGVAYITNANINDRLHSMSLFALPDDASMKSADDITTYSVYPSGVFSIQKEYDDQYVLVDYMLADSLLHANGRVTSLDIGVAPDADVWQIRDALAAGLGQGFSVQTIHEQHEDLFRIMRTEKVISYLILTLMLGISMVAIVGAISMVVVEKTRDSAVLLTMGLPAGMLSRVFLWMGALIGSTGALAGVSIAGVFALLQEYFGILSLEGGENFIIQAYPFEMQVTDVIVASLTVLGMGFMASVYPAWRAGKLVVAEALRK